MRKLLPLLALSFTVLAACAAEIPAASATPSPAKAPA
jgi:hypothetical protein